MRANWGQNDVELLKKHYPYKTASELKEILPNFTNTQINRKAKHLNITKKPEVRRKSRVEASLAARKDLWSDDEKRIVIEWYPKEGVKGVQERLPNHRPEDHIKKIAYRLGLNREEKRVWELTDEAFVDENLFSCEMTFKAK